MKFEENVKQAQLLLKEMPEFRKELQLHFDIMLEGNEFKEEIFQLVIFTVAKHLYKAKKPAGKGTFYMAGKL